MQYTSIRDLETIFTANALRRNRISSDTCFLCAKELTDSTRTVEHIIPRWIQDRCNIGDDKMTFRNGTSMLYKRATIPCCKKCNNECLSQLEQHIKKKLERGKEGIREVSPLTWYLWIGKIRLALAYKDCLIALDQKNPNSPRLGLPEEMDRISVIRHLLQFIRFDKDAALRISNAPDSVFTFFCQDTDTPKCQWDFKNLLHPMVTALRLGKLGVVVAFRDERYIEAACAHRLLAYRFVDLHPMQFIEVFARVSWIASHQHSYSMYRTSADLGHFGVDTIPAWKHSPEELFEDLDQSRFPAILHQAQEIEDTAIPDGAHHSILHYDDPEVIYEIPWSQVKAICLGHLFAGNYWIDANNFPDAPHFGPSHFKIESPDA
jgi:hypothetical protein